MTTPNADQGGNERHRARDDAKILLDQMHEVYQAVYDRLDSFEEENMGADLAYLLGAMLKGESCSWPAERPFIQILRELFPDANHFVWTHLDVESED